MSGMSHASGGDALRAAAVPAAGTGQRRRSDSGATASGFTLVELIVAMTLTVLVAGATVGMLNHATAARERLDRHAECQEQAQAAVEAIVTALRNACRSGEDGNSPLEGVDDQRGGAPADRIRFFTISRLPVRRDQPESDVRQCEFALHQGRPGELPDLAVRLDPTRNPPPDEGGVVQRIARNIAGLDFAYHDGVEWLPDWPKERPDRPIAIRIEVTAMAPAPPVETVTLRRIVTFPCWPQAAPGTGRPESPVPQPKEAEPKPPEGSDSAR